jgi:hypothetical protein
MPRRSLAAVVLALATLTACAGGGAAKRQKIVTTEAARLRAPEVPLTAFGAFEFLPVAMSAEVQEKEDKVAAANMLGQRMQADLQPLVQGWAANAPAAARGRTLQIQPTVVALRIVGGGARFWLGAMAGDSTIDVELSLVEKGSGRVVARERINKSSGGMAGAWSFGSTDQNLAQYVVDITHQYFVNNYK